MSAVLPENKQFYCDFMSCMEGKNHTVVGIH